MFQDYFGGLEGKTKAKKEAEWMQLQRDIAEKYQEYIIEENRYNLELGVDFVHLWADHFGKDKAAGAAEWWKAVADLGVERQKMMMDFRAWERGDGGQMRHEAVMDLVKDKDPRNRHNVWPMFLRELYLPTIGKMIQSGLDHARGMYNDLHVEMKRMEKAQAENRAREYFDQALRDLQAAGYEPGKEEVAGVQRAPRIPRLMREKLKALGYKDRDIRNMTMDVAREIIANEERPALTEEDVYRAERELIKQE